MDFDTFRRIKKPHARLKGEKPMKSGRKKAREFRSKSLAGFEPYYDVEGGYDDPDLGSVVWESWAPPKRDRFTAKIVTRPQYGAEYLPVFEDLRLIKEACIVLAEVEKLDAEKCRVHFHGYMMTADFRKAARPMTIDGRHCFATKKDELSPIQHIWRSMLGCVQCGAPVSYAISGVWYCGFCKP